MTDENMKEIYRNLQASQDKYTYFILAATIGAIGFAITKTQALKLNISQIPLAISVICWGLSFWFGCLNRQYYNSTLYANYELLKIQKGQHPQIGGHPQYINAASEGVKDAINHNSDKANKHGQRQMLMFCLGAIFFIIWHVYGMYLQSITFN